MPFKRTQLVHGRNDAIRSLPDGIHLLTHEKVAGGSLGDSLELLQLFVVTPQLQYCHILVWVTSNELH